MDYNEFLNEVINRGIEGVKIDYANNKNKMDGAIAGFEACRNTSPEDLVDLFLAANKYVHEAMEKRRDDYWYFRCYQAEIEWVLNVISVLLVRQGKKPLLSHLPTARALFLAVSILGIQE